MTRAGIALPILWARREKLSTTPKMLRKPMPSGMSISGGRRSGRCRRSAVEMIKVKIRIAAKTGADIPTGGTVRAGIIIAVRMVSTGRRDRTIAGRTGRIVSTEKIVRTGTTVTETGIVTAIVRTIVTITMEVMEAAKNRATGKCAEIADATAATAAVETERLQSSSRMCA